VRLEPTTCRVCARCVHVNVCQFYGDVARLDACLSELMSCVDTIDEQQYVDLHVSEQLIHQLQVLLC